MSSIDLNRGVTAPVSHELDCLDLRVTGVIPSDLNGVLVRNGPNPVRGHFNGHDVSDWWPEDAMLHGITLSKGRAVQYRNRWVRTQRWARCASPDAVATLVDTNPNVNVVAHAGEILALAEGGAPLAITTALDTLGPSVHHPGLADGMTAHPKIDPHTGELISFRANWQRPFLRYQVTDAGGKVSTDVEFDIATPSMMHDMAITATRTVLFDLNVGFDFSMLSRGFRMPLRWRDEHRARLGVIDRHGRSMRWFAIAPCFIQHVVNAYDVDKETVVLDVVRYPDYFRLRQDGSGYEANPLGVLWRYTVDLERGTVIETQLDDMHVELPRINERYTGQPYRYVYAVEQPTTIEMRGIVRCDLVTGAKQRFAVPERDQNSEPVFVARENAIKEADGWLLVCVNRHATDTTDLVILNAAHVDEPPAATVHLPCRVPAGFHGAWIDAVVPAYATA